MALTPAAVRRYARQIALPDIGPEGQERFLAACAAIAGDGLAATTAGEYLARAGIGTVRAIGLDHPWPQSGAAWLDALRGASVVVRAGFEDDPMLGAAIRLGIPAVVARDQDARVDVIAFRRHGPCPHKPLDRAPAPRAPEKTVPNPAAAVLAGTLAAAEALWILARPDGQPRARHLRLSLDGGLPLFQEIPWTPECFLCGGTGSEAAFS